ncbi:MAG TPA: dihydrodipicolinate synthase family protein [Pyrinomonadaceae bacterium]|nr:dihydrodipicolinate synthase family protein [Pyrinomonadaceae bacterium]
MKHTGNLSSEYTPSLASTRETLRGLLLPFTTPFKPNEDIDEEGLRSNLRKWNTSGIVGYVVLGSTGERVNLNEREYCRIIEVAREEVPDDLVFIVGAGQQSARGTIAEIKTAEILGAEAVMVITPSYYRSAITQDALIAYYTTVADSAPVPIILYSMPDLTGIKIEPPTVARLSSHPNIRGIKDSSADIATFRQTVEQVPDDFAVLTGNGTVFCDALRAGARGAVLAVGCIAFEVCLEIWRLTMAGENDKAKRLQDQLTPLALAVTKRYGIGGLKAAMDMIGFHGGAVRAPLKPAAEDARHEIARLLEQIRDKESFPRESARERGELAGVFKR